jgi:hypothetical protein
MRTMVKIWRWKKREPWWTIQKQWLVCEGCPYNGQ